jgi:hypothetical protein
LDLGNGTHLYVAGDEDLNLNLNYQGGHLEIHDDEHNQHVMRVLATDDLEGVIRGTTVNYTDYEWYVALNQWVIHRFGTGAPL